MATFSISKEPAVILNYYYEKNISVVSRNHVQIMLASQSSMRRTKFFLEKDS